MDFPIENGGFPYSYVDKPVWLVVEPYPSEKWWSESQLGWWFPICGKKMFQTTNQQFSPILNPQKIQDHQTSASPKYVLKMDNNGTKMEPETENNSIRWSPTLLEFGYIHNAIHTHFRAAKTLSKSRIKKVCSKHKSGPLCFSGQN